MTSVIDALRNRRILIVEDSPLVAMTLVDELECADAFVVGPVASIADAIGLMDLWQVDAAILDVELDGTLVYPLADILIDRGVPFIFMSGHDADFLPERFAKIPHSAKPAPAKEVLSMMAASLKADWR